jgi:DNA polymerase-3 subunit alpha
MVAYAMRITDLDPLEHGLIFERFLNPDRVSMPDFDIDFDERRRGEVIRYVTEKYGDDRVSMIVTYGTIKAKQAVKDSSRILGYPFAMGDRITKAMPAAVMGKDVPLKDIFDSSHKRFGEGGEFRALYDEDNDVKRVVDTAIGIEGLKRQWGVHAAGVIMSSEPLHRRHPAAQAARRRRDDHPSSNYPTCEALGPDQMDFLGSATSPSSTTRSRSSRPTAVRRGARGASSSTDEATYRLLQRGDTPRLSSSSTDGPMRSPARSIRPDCFEDISRSARSTAPVRWVRTPQQVRPPQDRPRAGRATAPRARGGAALDVLGETYGLIVYQEQVMAIAQKLAGYTLGQADILRRAMGKKKKEVLDKQFAASPWA